MVEKKRAQSRHSGAVCVYLGEALAAYAFGEGHPFGPQRYTAFLHEFQRRGLGVRVSECAPASADESVIAWFHEQAYVERVRRQSATGEGFLDYGDTPAFVGIYEAASAVAGTVVKAVDELLTGTCRRAFVPIAGLHHARRDAAAGFCVFNDCGIAIEALRRRGIQRIAYVDIDAHHGDGVYYGFEDDPDLCIVDFHEDGRFLYPGSGAVDETGRGAATGSKLNIPLPPGADDRVFMRLWPTAERIIETFAAEFIILQCGADSLDGDPLTDLRYTLAVHETVTRRLRLLAERSAGGRLLALGGGGYDLDNISQAWCRVIETLLED